MYKARTLCGPKEWLDHDGIKPYTVSADGTEVNQQPFAERLKAVKADLPVNWPTTAAFAIFHRGAMLNYMVLVWWGDDNELFNSVSVQQEADWIIDPLKYSFCLYDLEIMWRKRKLYIETVDCANPSIERYREMR